MAIVYTDTLVTDSTMMARWKADDAYNYGRELVQTDDSFWEWVNLTIARWMRAFNQIVEPSEHNQALWVIAGLVIIASIIIYIVIKHPTAFGRKDKKQAIDYQTIEDNIYGIDFATLINRAMERADYQAAVRLTYLQTLRLLSDAGRITWRKSKPPMQYAREVGSNDMRQLVLLFIGIRYGGYACHQEEAHEAHRLQQAICQTLDKEGGTP